MARYVKIVLRDSTCKTSKKSKILLVLTEGKPIICGGMSGSELSNKCFAFEGRTWTEAMSLMTTNSTNFGYYPHGHTSHPSWGFVVSGPGGENHTVFGVTRDGIDMLELPSLPEPVNYNCLLALDEHRLFSAGGSNEMTSNWWELLLKKASFKRLRG